MLNSIRNISRVFSTHPLTKNAPLKAWARFASWQISSRLQDEVIFDWIAGQRLVVRNGMTGATGNIYVGLHEFVDMAFLLHFLREGDLFLDIGANIGSYTILSSGACRAMTWAFEPDPNTLLFFKRNIAINKIDELVTVYDVALGSTQGEVPFTIGLDTINQVATADDKNVRLVRQEQLDNVIGVAQPIMTKIDVEGYEERVIQGAKNLLSAPYLKAIELETVTPWITKVLVSSHFEKAYYDPFSRQLNRAPIDLKSSNSLFIRDWPFVERRLTTARKFKVLNYSI